MKTKVVINCNYGGFGISDTAGKWLLANGIEDPFKSDIERGLASHWYGGMFDSYEYRCHPLLVKCVEELGPLANASYAELDVVEIEGMYYRIEDNDGIEDIITPALYNFTKNKYA